MAIEGINEEDIFRNAIQYEDRDEQIKYVKRACGKDIELYEAVESLLRYHDSHSILDGPAVEVNISDTTSPVTEGPGTRIGRYKLLEKIGEGGMAVVYMAEQEEPIRRRIALKIIKLGMDTRQVIARFEAERQALAMMDHPNIAKVLDAGATETGRPYFVMELVTGVSITEYCDKNNLSTKDRLTLLIQVCNAIQHAHEKGVIHRDIKPSNVMVAHHDGKPVPKVIDFGIAKAINQRLTEKTLFTRYAHIIGTPAYMSPEQAELSELGIDSRSDIYSLGVLLYELLTGTTPFSEEEFRKAGYIEMQRIIREEEPVKPSTKLNTLGETLTDIAKHRGCTPDLLTKSVRGDLDWIVMKSLEKERTQRYETVSELAADIERHLRYEPVLAGPPSASYRLHKFVRRNHATVITVALVIAALVVGATTVKFIGLTSGPGMPEHAVGMVQRHIWNVPPLSDFAGGVSPDGRYVSYIDWTAGNLAIRDLEAGINWLVTKNTDSTWKTIEGWVDSATMSPDGARMAYSWFNEQGLKFSDLRVVDLDGKNMRILYRDAATYWIWVYAWSPDAGKVLAYFADADDGLLDESTQQRYRKGHLALVSVEDGSVRIIKTWRRNAMPKKAAFSPDGRFVAYDLEQENNPDNRDLFLLDLETDSETALVEHPANDRLTGWTPDGRRVLFLSDRASRDGLWMIKVAGGAPLGAPRLLIDQFEGSPMGFGSDGSLYYTLAATATNVYIATLDAAGVQFVGEPRLASSRHIGSATMADWSPDGKLLAYRTDVSGNRTNTFYLGDWGIVINSIDTGEERVLTVSPPFRPDTRMGGPWWSPEGDRLLVSGTSKDTGYGLHQIDATTGQAILVMNLQKGDIHTAKWSPNAESIYFCTNDGLSRVELATGVPEMLLKGYLERKVFDLSPDGRWLAFWKSTKSMVVMPSTGGELREVVRLDREPSTTSYKFVKWTPDGEHLLYPDQDQMKKVDVETGRQQQIGPPMQNLIDVAINPDGTQIAFTIERGGSGLWVMENFLPE